jgi:nitrite reductase/ring-hydroxylating ferredoxin subunit
VHPLRQLRPAVSDGGHHDGTLLVRGALAMSELVETRAENPRREFLGEAARWTTIGAIGMAAVGLARMPQPGVLPGPSATVKLGAPGDYPVGAEPVRVPGQNLFVLHRPEGFAVVSAVCTHLGCIVAATPDGFECPCHGSRFGPDGQVTRGPAPSALRWYELGLSPDGRLVVDTQRTVPAGTMFQTA